MVPKGTTQSRGRVPPGLLGQRVQAREGLAAGRGRRWGSSRRRTSTTAESTASLAPPPTSVRTRGCCTRLGPGPGRARSRRTRRGTRPARCDQMASMAARCSRTTSWRRGEVDAVVLGLGPVPAEADAERDAPAREMVERGHLLGQDDRVVLGGEQDAGAEPDARRHGGRGGQRHERVEAALVVVEPHALDRAPAGCPRAPGGGCARAGRASRTRAPPPRRPARPARGRGR